MVTMPGVLDNVMRAGAGGAEIGGQVDVADRIHVELARSAQAGGALEAKPPADRD